MVKYGPLHYKALQADTCAALQINNIIYNGNALISPQAIKELNWYVLSIRLAYYYLTTHNQTGTLCTKASMMGWELKLTTRPPADDGQPHTGQFGLKSLCANHVIPTFDGGWTSPQAH